MRLLNRSAGRLSRRRRGPLAGAVVLILGLLFTGTLYAGFAPSQANETQTDAESIEAGRELFLVGCSFCHGVNGEGVLTQSGDTQLGPQLAGVGAASVDFQVGTGRMPMVQPGAQVEKKDNIYTEEETAQLAAFVASLGPGPAIPDESEYSLEGLSEEERDAAAQRGTKVFLSNCAACHNFAGSGGAMPRGGFAPKIRDVEPKYIYEALLTGPQSMPTFSNGNIPPESKRDVIAYLDELNTQPQYGGFSMGLLGPVAEGIFAWAGIGLLVVFVVWIAAHTTRSSRTKEARHE